MSLRARRGHALASRWLQSETGFPAPFALGGTQALAIFGVVLGVALFVVALPGYTAARVPVRVGLR